MLVIGVFQVVIYCFKSIPDLFFIIIGGNRIGGIGFVVFRGYFVISQKCTQLFQIIKGSFIIGNG